MIPYKVYLIEDRNENARETIEKLKKVASEYGNAEYDFEFEWLQGTVPERYDGKQYTFYDESVLEVIDKKIAEATEENCQMGLLLDVLLTKADLENTEASYYPQASISREIFFKFCDDIPIYFITSTSAFGGQSDIIMGKNLSGQYIKQQRLISDPIDSMKEELAKLFNFYLDIKMSNKHKER